MYPKVNENIVLLFKNPGFAHGKTFFESTETNEYSLSSINIHRVFAKYWFDFFKILSNKAISRTVN